MEIISNPVVENVFNNYPRATRSKMMRLRKLILDVAEKTKGVEQLEETLKWGEPSYLTKKVWPVSSGNGTGSKRHRDY